MDGPEQGHTQATDPAAASKDTGAIEPVIKGKHQKKKKKKKSKHLPVCSAGFTVSAYQWRAWRLPPYGCPQATFRVTVTTGRRKGPEAGSGIWGRE